MRLEYCFFVFFRFESIRPASFKKEQPRQNRLPFFPFRSATGVGVAQS